jgi:hypothetical protein
MKESYFAPLIASLEEATEKIRQSGERGATAVADGRVSIANVKPPEPLSWYPDQLGWHIEVRKGEKDVASIVLARAVAFCAARPSFDATGFFGGPASPLLSSPLLSNLTPGIARDDPQAPHVPPSPRLSGDSERAGQY